MSALAIYNKLSRPITPEKLEEAYALGMFPKGKLVHGTAYNGICRNARVAVWHRPSNIFLHERVKFTAHFIESIVAPEDDKGYDIFVPLSINEEYKLPQDLLEHWYLAYDKSRRAKKWREMHPELTDYKMINDYFNGDLDKRDQEMYSVHLEEHEKFVRF